MEIDNMEFLGEILYCLGGHFLTIPVRSSSTCGDSTQDSQHQVLLVLAIAWIVVLRLSQSVTHWWILRVLE